MKSIFILAALLALTVQTGFANDLDDCPEDKDAALLSVLSNKYSSEIEGSFQGKISRATGPDYKLIGSDCEIKYKHLDKNSVQVQQIVSSGGVMILDETFVLKKSDRYLLERFTYDYAHSEKAERVADTLIKKKRSHLIKFGKNGIQLDTITNYSDGGFYSQIFGFVCK